MPDRTAPRLLIIGWDAADWKIIDPLFQRGAMPNLRRLVESGVRASISSMDPKLSPLLWTTVATGKTADKHGILHFIEPDPAAAAARISSSTTRKTKALWNICSQSGLRPLVVSWYASHPAEPVQGVIVSNLFQESCPPNPSDPWPLAPGAVHPSARRDAVAAMRVHPSAIGPQALLPLVPRLRQANPRDPRLALLARLIAQCASVHNAATALIQDEPWDCAMLFYDTIDVVGHHFMQYHGPSPKMAHVSEADHALFGDVMNGIYQFHDLMLGTLLDLAGPDTTVILLSDHGFHSDHLRPPVQANPDDPHAAMDASWHRPFGVLAMAGPELKRGQTIYGATLVDVAPTALTLLGLPVGADMDGRILVEAFQDEPRIERVFSWDDLPGDAGLHPPDLRQDPFEAHDAMKQLADLGYISAPDADTATLLATLDTETRFNLGVVYLSTRRPELALPIFEALTAREPTKPRFAVNFANCCYTLGHYDRAAAALEPVIAAHPNLPDTRIFRAATLLAQGKPDQASAAYQEAEGYIGDRFDLRRSIAEGYLHLKRFPDAQRLLSDLVRADPHDPAVHHALAQLALVQERFEAAAEHSLRAVELKHFYPEAHYTLGVALTWMKDYDHAIQSFKVALSMQPGMIDAHRYIATIFRQQNNRAAARPHREAVENLVRSQRTGQSLPAGFLREAPMGPQEWATRLGLRESDDAETEP